MKFMVKWTVPPGSYKPAVKRFLKTGGPTPKGLKSIARWHAPVVEDDVAGAVGKKVFG